PNGTYDVVIDYLATNYNQYQHTVFFDDTKQITVNETTKSDLMIEIPLYEITGTITDPEGVPLEDVLVEAKSVADGSSFEAYIYTDASGAYTLLLPAGTYDFTYDPYYEDELIPEREAAVVVSADATHDYQFQATPATLEGTITINETTPLLFFSSLFVFGEIYLIDQYGVAYYGEMDEYGDYSVKAHQGSYTVYLGLNAIIGLNTIFFYEDEEFGTITLSDDEQTQDFDLTMYHLTGNVYMSDGVTPAVPTTIMATNTQQHITNSSEQTGPLVFITTVIFDAMGYYSLPVSESVLHMAMINPNEHLEYCNNIVIEDDAELDFVFAWDGEPLK
ncbi:MAG TPA: carboxypeptidase-like regulatory domain-containing protein, partial [bacterium]|nr:carboxypeptidase-like regulatory domain-containing protein [bacterium]